MLVIFSVIMYVVNHFLPLEPGLKNLVMLVLGIIFLIWLLSMFMGYATPFPGHWRSR